MLKMSLMEYKMKHHLRKITNSPSHYWGTLLSLYYLILKIHIVCYVLLGLDYKTLEHKYKFGSIYIIVKLL